MTDATTSKDSDARNPIPRWTEWLTLGLAASAWACVCLVIITKMLESAFISTWGRALRRFDIEVAFAIGAPMFAFASLASYLALCWVGRHTWKNTAGLVLGSLFPVGIMIMAAPNVGSGRERPRRTKCTSNLKQITLACVLYAQDNADAFPPDLGALLGEYITDGDLFLCPSGGHHLAGECHPCGPLGDEHLSYCYVSGLRPTDDGDFVLAFDEEWNHRREGVVVGNVGGQVYWQKGIATLHAKLEAQRGALAAEGREMRVIRPRWSRWPKAPEYPVRPWHERPGAIILWILGGVAALTLAGGAVALMVRRRRAIRAASAGGSGGTPSDGC